MVCIDTQTCSSKPIAWIDANGTCFFPFASNGARESNAHLEVSNSEAPNDKEVVSSRKRMKVVANDLEEAVGENEPCNGAEMGMLLLIMSPIVNSMDIDIIFRTPVVNNIGQVRFELFNQEVEVMRNLCGHANVRYAWLASSRDAVEELMHRGIMRWKVPEHGPTRGMGIYLAPSMYPNICASYADVEKNGIIFMLFCRVIIGNVELAQDGSTQFQPSNENFDSGVDDLQAPTQYIIWDMHKDARIFAEYVVAVKVPREAKENLVGKESISNLATVTNSSSLQEGKCEYSPAVAAPSQVEAPLSQGKAPAFGRAPKVQSPMRLVSLFFAALSTKVSTQDMDLLKLHYEALMGGKITNVDCVKKLRQIIGAKLLMSTLVSLKHKIPIGIRDGVHNGGKKLRAGLI